MNYQNKIFTIGHSNYENDRFIKLLTDHSINVIADVRQFPYSKYVPHFNKDCISKTLLKFNIKYIFLGDLLGARPQDSKYYTNNYVDFAKLAQASFFQEGLSRLKEGAKTLRIAIMCAEKDPVMCHRTILVCRNLRKSNLEILHILTDSTLEKNTITEMRLREIHKLQNNELFRSCEEIIEDAYNRQSKKMVASIESTQPKINPA